MILQDYITIDGKRFKCIMGFPTKSEADDYAREWERDRGGKTVIKKIEDGRLGNINYAMYANGYN